MSKQIRKMEIEPAENGGHTVTHYYRESPTHSSSKGMGMRYVEPESHVFGKSEGHAMLAHVANALSIPEIEAKEDEAS
jgi:hypothetical protein